MRKFFYRLQRLIYATSPFDEIIFSLPFLLIAVMIYWFKRRNIHKRSYGEKFKAIRRSSFLNEMIRLLSFSWIVEVIFVALTPTGFWYGVWGNIISGEYLNFRIWKFELSKPDLIPTVIDYALIGHFDWMFHSASLLIPHYIVNIALFVPLGLAFPFVAKKVTFLKTLLIGALCSLLIEFLQCFIGRDSSVEDLICNALGAIVGYLLYLLMRKLLPKFTEKCKLTANDAAQKLSNPDTKA